MKGETTNAAIDMRGRLLGLPAELRLPRLRGERRPAFWQGVRRRRGLQRGEGELERLKGRIIAAANALGLEGLDEVKELNALKGSYINLEYELPGGARAKFWDDDAIYLGTFLPKAGTGRFYGLASDGEYLLAAESGPLGEDAELIVFKRLKV